MDSSLPVVTDDGDPPWSDSHSMDPDDGRSTAFRASLPWLDPVQLGSAPGSHSSTMSSRHDDQLSPISVECNMAVHHQSYASELSSVTTMPHSASSSPPDSWEFDYGATEGVVDLDDGGIEAEINWQGSSDEVLLDAKSEPFDDFFPMEDIQEAPTDPAEGPSRSTLAATQAKTKRPRGRPRKHPVTPIVNANKFAAKGRSKTGCLTCRKRKKKCDEAKPRCMNCEKNAVVCEGYPEKQIWRSGKERAEEERRTSHSLPSITRQPIFHGLETVEDGIFWRHYNERLSNVLTLEGEHGNAFKDMIVPIAARHRGLMHSILCLASKHIDYETPYGEDLLRKHPSTSVATLNERSNFHHHKAVESLCSLTSHEHDGSDEDSTDTLSVRYGQVLCLLLESVAEGQSNGQHRIHLDGYQKLMQEAPPEDPHFLKFVTEFFQYHVFADELLSLHDGSDHRLASGTCRAPPCKIDVPRMNGVADGLSGLLSRITTIRNTIRYNMRNHIDPVSNYSSVYQAAAIEQALNDWTPHAWPAGDSRNRVNVLYKQAMWIYLFRTASPPAQGSASSSSSSSSLPTICHANIVNTPPDSVSGSCSSSPRVICPPAAYGVTSPPLTHSNPPSRKSSRHQDDGPSRADEAGSTSARPSPPRPIRPQAQHDPRLTLAVEETLNILDQFAAADPAQTLLLIPCLVVGTACFAPSQQARVRAAVRAVKGYTGLRNAGRAAELLEQVWRCMDEGDWARVWDWQGVAESMGLDFLCC